jgi:hypothetical protein
MTPSERRRWNRMLESAMSDEDVRRRLRKRLRPLVRERRRRADEWDDAYQTPGDFAAEFEANFPGLRPKDLLRDWGRE